MGVKRVSVCPRSIFFLSVCARDQNSGLPALSHKRHPLRRAKVFVSIHEHSAHTRRDKKHSPPDLSQLKFMSLNRLARSGFFLFFFPLYFCEALAYGQLLMGFVPLGSLFFSSAGSSVPKVYSLWLLSLSLFLFLSSLKSLSLFLFLSSLPAFNSPEPSWLKVYILGPVVLWRNEPQDETFTLNVLWGPFLAVCFFPQSVKVNWLTWSVCVCVCVF